MKLATLWVPAYLPRPYEGATPVPYQSGTVDQFEKKLAELSPLVVRHMNATRLRPDSAGRFAHVEIVTPYQIAYENDETALGAAVLLALKVFKLEKLAVTIPDNGTDMGVTEAEELEAGIHAWNEEV